MLSALARWIPYPHPGDTLSRPIMSWMVVKQWTGAQAGGWGVANSGAQARDQGKEDGVNR